LNKIREKGRTGSAWKQGVFEEWEGAKGKERNGPNYVCTYEKINKKF
jgi:hypothetical protein